MHPYAPGLPQSAVRSRAPHLWPASIGGSDQGVHFTPHWSASIGGSDQGPSHFTPHWSASICGLDQGSSHLLFSCPDRTVSSSQGYLIMHALHHTSSHSVALLSAFHCSSMPAIIWHVAHTILTLMWHCPYMSAHIPTLSNSLSIFGGYLLLFSFVISNIFSTIDPIGHHRPTV